MWSGISRKLGSCKEKVGDIVKLIFGLKLPYLIELIGALMILTAVGLQFFIGEWLLEQVNEHPFIHIQDKLDVTWQFLYEISEESDKEKRNEKYWELNNLVEGLQPRVVNKSLIDQHIIYKKAYAYVYLIGSVFLLLGRAYELHEKSKGK